MVAQNASLQITLRYIIVTTDYNVILQRLLLLQIYWLKSWTF